MNKPKRKKGESKVGYVQREYKSGTLRSGSANGPKVTNPKQAIAIGLSEQRKESGKKKPPMKASIKRKPRKRPRNSGRS